MLGIPEGHPLLGRVVADNRTDPAGWLAARSTHIGASDAKAFAKITSAEGYARSMLAREKNPWKGSSAYADNGNTYEQSLMLWAGLEPSARMFRHPDVEWITATPDGVGVTSVGDVVNGEAKVKHHIVTGPDRAELRQVAHAQYVTGARMTKWVWLHVHPETHRPYGDPQVLRIPRLDELIAEILPIAHRVHDLLEIAHQIERENRP